MEENFNLPILRVEQAGVFYACNRLSVTTWTCFLWSRELGEKGVLFTVFSRVLNKNSTMALALIRLALERHHRPNYEQLCLWSDCGPHFRSKRSISTLVGVLAWEYKMHSSWSFWAEQHGKSTIDGYFGTLSQQASEKSHARDIVTISDLVATFEEAAELRQKTKGTFALEEFIEHDPPEMTKVPMIQFTESTWRATASVQACYSWHARLTDSRRLTPYGRGFLRTTMTAIDFKAMLLTGMRGADHRTTHPQVIDEMEPPPPENDEVPIPLGMETKIFRGWRVSYRFQQAEVVDRQKIKDKLVRKADAMIEVLPRLPEGHRHRTDLQLAFAAVHGAHTRSTTASKVCKSFKQ